MIFMNCSGAEMILKNFNFQERFTWRNLHWLLCRLCKGLCTLLPPNKSAGFCHHWL